MERCRVLVIEDEPAISEMLRDVLDADGHEVTVADSTLGAPALIRDVEPDAILLDLGLPYRSGASLLTDLKADAQTARIPVIVVSGLADSLTRQRRALAFDVFVKPFDAEQLLQTVRAACESVTQQPDRAAGPDRDSRTSAGQPELTPD